MYAKEGANNAHNRLNHTIQEGTHHGLTARLRRSRYSPGDSLHAIDAGDKGEWQKYGCDDGERDIGGLRIGAGSQSWDLSAQPIWMERDRGQGAQLLTPSKTRTFIYLASPLTADPVTLLPQPPLHRSQVGGRAQKMKRQPRCVPRWHGQWSC